MKNLFFYLMALTITFSLASCKKDKGTAAETTEAQEVATMTGSATYDVNTTASTIAWEGYKPTGTHNGTIQIQEGRIEVTDGKVAGGKFTLDLNSITVLDLQGEGKAKLEGHLKGMADESRNDFFDVRTYPTATFEITKVTGLMNDESGANTMVYGNLTMKDKTNNIGFKAKVDVNANTVTVSTPKFNIDRTLWGVNYGSKTVFDNLGDNFVNNEIGLTLNITGTK